jgi:hypothetical protein
MIRVTAECICIVESCAMCQWILEAMEDMEPQFLLSNVRLVFADQLITDNLLVQLGINETCLLHRDPRHLLNKVVPDTFGNKHDSLFPCLQIMTNGTREDWEAAFQNASRLLVGFPLHLESLKNVHNNPSHCCKWHLNDLEGNFNFDGSVPAEQNNSSIAAHMGHGGNFAIAKHDKALVNRQIHLAKQR